MAFTIFEQPIVEQDGGGIGGFEDIGDSGDSGSMASQSINPPDPEPVKPPRSVLTRPAEKPMRVGGTIK
jgi:hypothetical protein